MHLLFLDTGHRAPVYSDGLQRLGIWTRLARLFVPTQGNTTLYRSSSSHVCVFTCLCILSPWLQWQCGSLLQFCQSKCLEIWLDVQKVTWFCISVCVICSISLIRPSAVFSCSLMNAQRWGEAWKWLFQNSFFDFSGISWNFSSLINSNGFLSIKLIKKDCLSLSALLSAG